MTLNKPDKSDRTERGLRRVYQPISIIQLELEEVTLRILVGPRGCPMHSRVTVMGINSELSSGHGATHSLQLVDQSNFPFSAQILIWDCYRRPSRFTPSSRYLQLPQTGRFLRQDDSSLLWGPQLQIFSISNPQGKPINPRPT